MVNFRNLLLTIALTLCAGSVMDARDMPAVTSPAPGLLSTVIDHPELTTSLSVTGSINAADIYFISASMPLLTSLDLSQATIAGYSGKPLGPSNTGTHPAHTIPPFAFMGSPASEITLPEGTLAIGYGAFAGCNISSISLPEGVTAIEAEAFSSSALTSISLPQSIKHVGSGAFRQCIHLEHASILARLDKISDRMFAGCSSLTLVELPLTLQDIGNNAFECSGLTACDLSECSSLRHVGNWAFASSPALTSVILPTGVTSIGHGAFMGDKSLTSITLSDNLGKIPALMLYGASALSEIRIPAGTDSIATLAMARMNSLTSVDARSTHSVPALEPDVWNSTATEKVRLYVPERLLNSYLTADQWKDFDIEGVSGIENITADAAARLKINIDGGVIHIEAPEDIQTVTFTDCAGRHIKTYTANSHSCDIDANQMPHGVYILQCQMQRTNATIKISI